jgi:hypothetical protein
MKNPQYVSEDNAMGFLSDNGGTDYNLCHCKSYLHGSDFSLNTLIVWSNFEIADMDFWRSEAYMKYFEFLESKGGFYYEVSIVRELYQRRLTIPFNRDGEMRLFIQSVSHCSPEKIKYIFSKKLGTDTTLSSTALKESCIERVNVGVRRATISIMRGMLTPFSIISKPSFRSIALIESFGHNLTGLLQRAHRC